MFFYYVVSCGPLVYAEGENKDLVKKSGETNTSSLLNRNSTLILWEKDMDDKYIPIERKDGVHKDWKEIEINS